MNTYRVGLIGHKFMGRTHTHAYSDLPLFADLNNVRVENTLSVLMSQISKPLPVNGAGNPGQWIGKMS